MQFVESTSCIRNGKSHSQTVYCKAQGLPCSIQHMRSPRRERGGDDEGVCVPGRLEVLNAELFLPVQEDH